MDIIKQLQQELQIGRQQVEAAVKLIDEGNTIPFIARYRKEATGSLNDEVLRNLDERLRYLRNLEERKEQVISSIREQEKLTPELEKQIQDAPTLVAVEDLYRPYRPKRRTRAIIAKEKGLEPLANVISLQMIKEPLEQIAKDYVSEEKGVATVKDAIAGAKDILAEYSEQELYRMIRDYGEDKFAKNIAKHIVQARQEAPIETTGQLNEIIRAAIPAKVRATGGHPAKRTFQAIRIELNHELDVLENSIDRMIDFLNPGGRLSIITFHSLEDRIVKNRFRINENPCTCPPEFPVCVCGNKPKGKALKSVAPSAAELEENPRARSARLRVFEKY